MIGKLALIWEKFVIPTNQRHYAVMYYVHIYLLMSLFQQIMLLHMLNLLFTSEIYLINFIFIKKTFNFVMKRNEHLTSATDKETEREKTSNDQIN